MKKIKLNAQILQLKRDKIANLTNDKMVNLNGGTMAVMGTTVTVYPCLSLRGGQCALPILQGQNIGIQPIMTQPIQIQGLVSGKCVVVIVKG